MNRRIIAALTACAAAALAASAASVCYEGRFLNASGTVQANRTIEATLSAYETENASTAFATKSITITTDASGHFAAVADGIDAPQSCSTFWIGVTPSGYAEIRPRMRVSPAPFAIVSANVARMETSGRHVAKGTVGVSTLAAGPSFTADEVALTGDTMLKGNVDGAQNIYLKKLDLDRGALNMLRANSPGNISTRWDEFAADAVLSLTDTTGFFSVTYNQTESLSLTALDDGFAIVLIKVAISVNDSSYWVEGTLENGDFRILDNTRIGRTQYDDASRSRIFTFPVRKGKTVKLTLHNHRGYTTRDVRSWAKVKMVYIGAN